MKKNRNKTFTIALLVLFAMNLGAQSLRELIPMLSGSGESVDIQTDRSVYTVNEKIFFSAHYQLEPGASEISFSQVLYAELIRWNGGKIAFSKSLIKNHMAHGYLSVPGDLESGVYYLRAYTKWMRNFSPYAYAYIPVRIVNPTSPEIENGPLGAHNMEKVTNEVDVKAEADLSFTGLEKEYGRREKVEFELDADEKLLPGTYTLSIARKGSLDPGQASFSFISEEPFQKKGTTVFLPELRGMSLSGKAIKKDTNEPIRGMKVSLSSTENSFYLASATTDSLGSFLFTFPPVEGENEFILSDINQEDESSELLIDSDFCSRTVTLPYIPFKTGEDEMDMLADLILNMQLQERFAKASLNEEQSELNPPFYGHPTRTIYEKDFIELENLEEFLFELVYEVTVRENNGERRLYMTGQSTLASYPILVLMDNIPVSNLDDFLKVVCRRIDRLEIVRRGYIVGDYMYSGILSVYSEGHNMAGLSPDKNSRFFKIPLLNQNGFSFPMYNDKSETESRIPDRRSTLYWNPDVVINDNKPTKVSFYTSDAKGEYVVVLRKKGHPMNELEYFESSFRIK